MMKLLLFFLVVTVEAAPCSENQQCDSCAGDGRCTSECFSGYYGLKCNLKCSQGCRNNICKLNTKGDDECTDGCKLGFYGPGCTIPCETHVYPCIKCPQECEGEYCQLETSCAQGCQDSYYGNSCKSCPAWCEVCNRVSGTCEVCLNCEGNCTHGCLGGCKPGYFGNFCEHSCSSKCLSGCEQTSGDCFKCESGWFGASCENQCPNRCVDEKCDMDGICTLGCTLGWFGLRCNNECLQPCVDYRCDRNGTCTDGCKLGFHGKHCQNKCPAFCFNKLCDFEDGSCKSCEKGFYGNHCNNSCVGCIDGVCSQDTGRCMQGCVPNYRGEFCQHNCTGDCVEDECREVCKTNPEIKHDSDPVSSRSRSAVFPSYLITGVSLIFIIFVVIIVYVTFHFKRIYNEKFYWANWHTHTGIRKVEQEDTSSINSTSESDCSQVGVQVVVLKQLDAESRISVNDDVVEEAIDNRELLMNMEVEEDLRSYNYTVSKLDIAGKKGESRVTGNALVCETSIVNLKAMRENKKELASCSGNMNRHGKEKIKISLENDLEYENGIDDRKILRGTRQEETPYCDRCFHEGKGETDKIEEHDLIFDNNVIDYKSLKVPNGCLSNNPSEDLKRKYSIEAPKQDEIDNANDQQGKVSDTAGDIRLDYVEEVSGRSNEKATKGDEAFEDHYSDDSSDATADTGKACCGNGSKIQPAMGKQNTFREPTVREHQSASVAINEHDNENHYVEVFLLND